MALIKHCCLCLLLFFGSWQLAAEPETQQQQYTDSGFTLLQDLPTKNQIPLFDNRFRIDSEVESITLLFFRRQGSASVVLVRPDGSKIHAHTASKHQVRWFDAASYDLIEITEPMPGPWQAIGRILPESRILVLTDIQLDVDLLPEHLMVGETVKVTARLMNGDQPINARDFRDVLSLDVLFISTNNPDYDNYGRGVIQVANFRDDGRGFDERARDGIFTGEFRLDFSAGEWLPKYIVRTPLYTREVEQESVMLQPAPIQTEVILASNEQTPHQLRFNLTEPAVLADSVLVQGRIRYPDGTVDTFALTDAKAPRELLLDNRGYGSYILEVSAYGSMQNGREFMLNLPEYRFMFSPPPVLAPEIAMLPEQLQAELVQENAANVEADKGFPWGWVIGINFFILAVGGGAIWLVLSGKHFSDLLFWRKKPAAAVSSANTSSSAKDTSGQQNSGKAQKNNDLDDILDLSLPDD
ncbi:TIGR03503 family protein [Arsukibacterium sp.]|uniref:TIGR03503 family protein n=1 Tax=Arsukibacterium sp. TaxID=1977258 RepID=UPI002FD9EAF8